MTICASNPPHDLSLSGVRAPLGVACRKFWLALIFAFPAFGQTSEPPHEATAKSSPPSQVSPITQSALQGGVLSCITRINQVASFLTGNGQSGAFLFTQAKAPDQSLFSFSLEVAAPGSPVAYASGSFAPNQANGCGAMYETVTYWEQRCEEVARKQFPGLKVGAPLYKNVLVVDGGQTMRVFLLPAGKSGCVAIKKELVGS